MLPFVILLLTECSVNLDDLRAIPKTDAAFASVDQHPAPSNPDMGSYPIAETNTPSTNSLDAQVPDTNSSDASFPNIESTDASPIPPNTVMISNGQAVGVMKGQSWISIGNQDVVTDPTCDEAKIIGACSTPTWNAPNMLCVTGDVPVVIGGDYTDNWGILFGVTSSTFLPTSYSTIAINFTGPPSTELVIMIHRVGDLPSTDYCHSADSSGKIWPLTSFNTTCGGGGTAFTVSDASKIDWVALQIIASPNSVSVVTNLCLESIVFGT